MNHRYNVKTERGPRFSMAYSHIFNDSPLPSMIDLRAGFPACFDQGQEGSCTAHAWAGLFAFMQLMGIREKAANLEEYEFQANQYVAASRQFIYYCEREFEDDVQNDGGAMISTGARVLTLKGACEETLWPYTSTDLFTEPNQDCYDEARKHVVPFSYNLSSLNEILHSLANGFPVVAGIMVYPELESQEVADSGLLPMPADSSDANCLGGHAICVAGYDNSKQLLLVRNSWGAQWAEQGYFWMPFEYLEKFGSEFMTLRK